MIWRNGILAETHLDIYPDHPSNTCIYEVIRVVRGCPVFLEQHINRLFETLKLSSLNLATDRFSIIRGIAELIQAENKTEGNLRIQISRDKTEVIIGFIPHHYPTSKQSREGVRADFLEMERPDPNLKIWNPNVRKAADERIRESDAYEIILINKAGFLTEGSRSNIFMIMNNELCTPPVSRVLPGITRQIIFQEALKNSIDITEKDIHLNQLSKTAAAFISGTSPGVLTLRRLGHYELDPFHDIITKINTLYLNAIEQNIQDTVTNYTELFYHD